MYQYIVFERYFCCSLKAAFYKVIYIQYLVDLCTVYLDPLYLGIVDMMLYYLFLKICFLQQICFRLNKFQLA